MLERRTRGWLVLFLVAVGSACGAPAATELNTPPPPIVLFHDPSTGAGWDVTALLARDPYDYGSEPGLLRDALQRFLQDGIFRMTKKRPAIVERADLTTAPEGSLLVVLYRDAPPMIHDDPTIRAALGYKGDEAPAYVGDRESFYLQSDAARRTWIVANTVDGLVAAMPALLDTKGYEVLGLGPNWIYAPDLTGQNLEFSLHEGHRNEGFAMRSIGGFGGGGQGSLTVELPLTSPDEPVTTSYSRWRIGTRMNAGSSVPFFTGDSLDSYVDPVLARMRQDQTTVGFLTAKTVLAPAADRPPAAPDNLDWLWIDSDADTTWYSDGVKWTQGASQAINFSVDLSVPFVRSIIFESMRAQANVDAWERPDEWTVFGTQPADGPGMRNVATWSAEPQWYEQYRQAEGQAWGPHVLDGFLGIDLPIERWDASAPSDVAFGFGNWLLREYDKWIDTLPPGPQTDPAVPTQLTRSGQSRKALIRSGISSYNENDVPPHFNLDPRIRVIVAGFAKHRGNDEWPMLISREAVAAAMQRMLPDEPIANYASSDDWGWDPAMMSYVLPHQWGNSAQSILDMFESFRKVGVRSWAAETEMGYTQHALGFYLMGQYLWNPALGPAGLESLRTRWLERAFGPGAQAMRAYFDATEPGAQADNPYFWSRAIALLDAADAVIPDDTDAQRRLDDVKQFWYFYYLMATGQLDRANPRARELMWKDQSAFTVCNYELAYWVFFTPWVAEMPELRSPIDYTAGPAHYTPAEIAEWWALVRAYWPYEPAAAWTRDDVDLDDLVAVDELAGWEGAQPSDALHYSSWDTPFVPALQVALAPGDDVGFQLLWPAYDPPQSQEYFGHHDTSWSIDRWDATARAWQPVTSGMTSAVRLAASANALGAEAWHVAVHHAAGQAGTFRTTVGYGGIGILASPDWDVASPLGPIADSRGPTFATALVADAQPTGGDLWIYVPKGVTSLDFEILDSDTTFPKSVTLYRGLPLTETTPARSVEVTTRGTHRVALAAEEAGGLARFDLGAASFTVPYFHSVPRLWARSPSALLVPRAIAAADGLHAR